MDNIPTSTFSHYHATTRDSLVFSIFVWLKESTIDVDSNSIKLVFCFLLLDLLFSYGLNIYQEIQVYILHKFQSIFRGKQKTELAFNLWLLTKPNNGKEERR
jgi:hypothetical protein